MIIHKSIYGFYNQASDEANIITDCKRSNGNANKIYHKVNSKGDIIESKYFDEITETLIITPTTIEQKLKSKTQRYWVMEKHKIFNSNDSKSKKQSDFDKLSDKYHFKKQKL